MKKAQELAATKVCNECGKRKSLSKFFASQPQSRKCKDCQNERMRKKYASNREEKLAKCAEYRKANKERIKRSMADWYKVNRDHVLKRCHEYNKRENVKKRESKRQATRYAEKRESIVEQRRRYYESNPEAIKRIREYSKAHYRQNKPMYFAKGAKRRAARLRATPLWADTKAIEAFYVEAARKTAETGIKHVVDHIIPLQGRTVSGLHVENNLRVITEIENLQKSNKLLLEI